MAEQVSSAPTRKVAVQAFVTVLAFVLLKVFGVELEDGIRTEITILLEVLIPVVTGFGAAYFVKPAKKDGIVQTQ